MIIRVTRSGGFAGIEEDLGAIDTGAIENEQAREIANLMTRLVAAQAQPGSDEHVGADMFRYEMAFRDEQGVDQRVSLLDDGDPESQSVRLIGEVLEVLGIA